MFYNFKKGKQRQLIEKAINKAGSERKLSSITNIPKGSISALKFEIRNLSDKHAEKICRFLDINLQDMHYEKTLPSNWGQVKGGKNLIKIKKKTGTIVETIERLKIATNKRLKEWHRNMKENNPEQYHLWQYERFKKIGKGYTYMLSNRIKVRNSLEQEIGNFLLEHYKETEYGPYLNIRGKAYFPDFKIKNVLIEVTEWKHPELKKREYLKKKCIDYKKQGYISCFFIPPEYRKFYKFLKSPVITSQSELKRFLDASIA